MQKFKDLIYYNRKEICLVIIFLILFSIYIFFNNENKETVEDEVVEIEKPILEEFVVIDIKGEVKNPGTYKLKKEDRIIDAIDISGGLTSDADTTKINLSERLTDEMLIVIPKINNEENENIEVVVDAKETKEVKDSKISINNASIDELMTIKGIGFTKASNIVEYRNKNGKFKSIEDLLNVSGIGKSTFDKIKDFIKI